MYICIRGSTWEAKKLPHGTVDCAGKAIEKAGVRTQDARTLRRDKFDAFVQAACTSMPCMHAAVTYGAVV